MPDPAVFQSGIANFRLGAYLIGLLLALLGFGFQLGWGVGAGIVGVLVALGALLEKN